MKKMSTMSLSVRTFHCRMSQPVANMDLLSVSLFRLKLPNLWILFVTLCSLHLVNPASPPYITRQPEDMENIFLGNTVAVTCDAIGEFPLKYKWTKDGQTLGDFEATGKSHLLPTIQKDDAGSYRCLVNNFIGTVMSRSAKVTVKYTEGFTGNSKTEFGQEGQALVLTCNDIDSYPEPAITWTIENIPIENSGNKIMTLDNRLVILDYRNADQGPYRCKASNPLSAQPHTSPAIMLFFTAGGTPPTGPEIVVPPRDLIIKEGDSIATFECIVNGRPLDDIVITWRKDNEILRTGGKEVFKYNIFMPREEDEGEYECEAELDGRIVRARATLTIYIPPEFFITPDAITMSSVGSVVDLPCQATGVPRPTVTWYRNAINVETITDNRYRILQSGSLQIQNLLASDAGMFQCLVSNEVGEDITDTWLQVQEIAPLITKKPNNTVVIENSPVTLECKAMGAPHPEFKWTQDGVTIATKDSILDQSRMSLEGGDLRFDRTLTSDTGTYMCIADNGVGIANATASLGVYVRTIIATKPQDTEVELGQSTVIDCVVHHDPLVEIDVKWYHNNQLVNYRSMDSRWSLQQTGSLEIRNARPSDSGLYICEVASVAGSDDGGAELVIVELPHKPRNVRGVISTDISRAILLSWVAPFNGNTALIRYVIEQKEDESSFREIESNISPLYTNYTVTGVKPSRSYRYRVTAENRVGRGETSDVSNVIELPPEAPDDPPQGVVASASSTTSIIVEWQEPPEASWNGALRGYVVRSKLEGYSSSAFAEEVIEDNRRTSFTITNLITWRRYEIQVAAWNGAGTGPYSESVRVRTNEGVPQRAPDSVTTVAVNSTAIRFTWEGPPPQFINGINQGYKLHAWKPLNPSVKTEVIIPPDPSGGIQEGYITGLDKYTNYLTSVLCFTNPGDGPRSNPQSVDTHEDIPGAVGNLKFIEVGDVYLRVQWQPPASPNGMITGFEVGWQNLNRTSTFKNQKLSPQENEFRITNLRSETTYEIFVWAYTNVGRGEISTATVKSGVPPEPPTPPTNVAVSNVQARSVTLQFIPGFDGYTSISLWITEALVGENQQWQVIYQLSEPNANSYEVADLIPYTDYQFRIIAKNVVNQSAPSQPSRKIETQQDVPAVAPREVTVRSFSEKSLRVRWVPLLDSEWSGEPEGYHIFWKETDSSSAERQYTLDDPNLSEYIIGGLEEWTKYSVRVQAENERGLGPISIPATERTSDTVPSAGPEGVSSEPKAFDSIDVSWGQVPEKDRNGDILGFKILYQETISRRRSTRDSEEMSLEVPGSDSRSATLSGLRGYTQYSIKVLAYTRIGDGIASDPVIVTTLESEPGPPDSITFPVVTRNSIEVTWQPPLLPNGRIEKYKVGFRQQQHPAELENEVEIGSFTRHRVERLVPEVYYIFRVTAKTRLGWGEPAVAVVFTTNNRTVPQAPSMPIVDRVESRQVRISWTEGENGKSPLRTYSIQAKKDSGLFTDHATGVKAGITSYTVEELSPYSSYQFRLQAHNDVGASPYSPASESIDTLIDIPDGSPTILEVMPVTTTSVMVKWQAPPQDTHNGPLLGHRILFRQLPDPGYMEQIINDPSVSENLIQSLEKYHNYEIKVAAYNVEGVGPYSRPVTVFVGEAIPSAPPTGVKVVAVAPSVLKVTWTPPSVLSQNGGLQGYKIVYWVKGDKRTEKFKTFAESSNTVLLEGLICWTRYNVQVRGFNAAGEGPLSQMAENRTLENVPGIIPSLTFSKIRMTSLVVHWDPPSMPCGPIHGYQVFYQLIKPINGEKATITVDLGGTATSYKVEKLGEKADYMFRVSAKTANYGPFLEANVTTGPQQGAPDPPAELRLRRSKTHLVLQWKRPANQGRSRITNYIIEFLEDGRDEWELLTDTIPPEAIEYLISYGNLKASTSYRFRVMAENEGSISYPTAPSEIHNTPTAGGLVQEGEFYQQWWFLVILALVGLIIIILVTATLCMLGKSRLYIEKKVHKRIPGQPEEAMSVEDGGFATFEMNSTVTATARARNKQDPYNRAHKAYTRAPPRPSPGSIVYSEEEESKHYEDVHRRDLTEVAESCSLTEKSDLQSQSESQDTDEISKIKSDKEPIMGSEMESDLEDQFPTDPHSFVNHYASLPTTQSWRRQQKGPKAYSYTDSESSMNNGSVMLNGLANMPAGSRAPVHGFSSFV